MPPKPIPYKSICDAVFKKELLPAVYRWISNLSPEELARFKTVFPVLASDEALRPSKTSKRFPNRLQPSRYTMPEWNILPEVDPPRAATNTIESWLARPTTSHTTYGTFTEEQGRVARAVPTRTRQDEKSTWMATTRSPKYMASWADRNMNTTYQHDYCHSGFARTLRDQTRDQTVIVYSKATLGPEASIRACEYIDVDPVWTRDFREMCRSLRDAIEATAYREAHTTMKSANGLRFTHPRWTDPVPVSVGLARSAEQYWSTTHRRDFIPLVKTQDTTGYDDQHRARYSKPFDNHPMTDKPTTVFMAEFVDHMKNKDDQPLYWTDMVVRIPPGTAPVGEILGKGSLSTR
jgi:hypothetical protein